ncbi:UDP-N-acetylmuramate dehydrogenase [Zhouia sp. PK063]|uniref:UDP-N-acetylmuramate dehydrogenase n=1 Tax=Zhouia sp. PK063 TaxID=3373602 RepID=UPI0037988DEF
MTIKHNISLKPYNTFGIDVNAKNFISITSLDDLKTVLQLPDYPEKFIIGGGSNMLLTQNIDALTIHINLRGKEIVKQTNDTVLVKIAAGENWHQFVLWAIDNDFGGVENLSLIPGNVGTSPVQNIGAYGVELKDVFYNCSVLEIATGNESTFSLDACNFGYRNSVFKNAAKNKYIITSVTFKLTTKNHSLNTSYGAIEQELKQNNINNPSLKDVSNAVISIRQSKLPNPKEIGNSGSFFKNPVISIEEFHLLQQKYPNIPSYTVSDSEIKIPAGWLIEQVGFKGKRFGDAGVHKNQALVLVNYGNASGQEILDLAYHIIEKVKETFNIEISPEVNIL